jgi:hypothetical protein
MPAIERACPSRRKMESKSRTLCKRPDMPLNARRFGVLLAWQSVRGPRGASGLVEEGRYATARPEAATPLASSRHTKRGYASGYLTGSFKMYRSSQHERRQATYALQGEAASHGRWSFTRSSITVIAIAIAFTASAATTKYKSNSLQAFKSAQYCMPNMKCPARSSTRQLVALCQVVFSR